MVDWRQFRLFAADMDGTLAGADHHVTPRTITALRKIERAGIKVLLITGRSPPTVLDVWQRAQLSAPVVTFGGALILQPSSFSVVQERVITRDTVANAVRLGGELELTVSLWTLQGLWATRADPYAHELARIIQMPLRVLSPAAAPVPPVMKIGFSAEPNRLDALQPLLVSRLGPGITMARSMPQILEGTAPHATKHDALEAVLGLLGIPPSAVIVAGDGENDTGMLRLAGYAVVPANGMAGPRQLADRLIGHHDAEAVATFLEEVLADVANREHGVG